MDQLRSVLGLFLLMALAWTLSTNRRAVPWRVVIWGTMFQIVVGIFVFLLPVGGPFFLAVNKIVFSLLDSASAGTQFLFGRLALPPGTANEQGETSLGFFLAFQALPTLVFFASLVGLLYHLGIMQLLIRGFSRIFTALMGISGAESLAASSNIFVGVESALAIRPYLERMTRSELCTVLTAGMATVASTVMGLYVTLLGDVFPNIAGHLVSASVLSAPAAVVMSKLLVPEDGRPETAGKNVAPVSERASNWIEATINGAASGLRLVAGVAALLLAFLGLVHLVDQIVGGLGGLVNTRAGWSVDWSLSSLLGYAFYPLTWILGVATGDVGACARLIGERTILTEVPAYQELASLMAGGGISARSAVITAYALCGFAHVPSLAIFVGGISALAPSRTKDLASLGFRGLLAAILATLMTGAVAGAFVSGDTILGMK
jgi:CNT family concentrative nucleoside transporter